MPGLLSLPFLAWNADAFVRSILFSATRNANSRVSAFSFDANLGLTGLPARLPMLLLMALVLVAAARGEIGRYLAVLLVFATFMDFNSRLLPAVRGVDRTVPQSSPPSTAGRDP